MYNVKLNENKNFSPWWDQNKALNYKNNSWLHLDTTCKNYNKGWYQIDEYYNSNNSNNNNYLWKFQPDYIEQSLKQSYKLKLNLTKNQKTTLENWAGSSRFTYNKSIASLNNKKNSHKNWQSLRNRYVTYKKQGKKGINNFFNNKEWLLDCPAHIRVNAVKEAVKNRKSCFTNKSNGNIDKFNMGFKTKRYSIMNGWTIEFDKINVIKNENKLYIYKRKLGEIRYYNKKQLHKLIPDKNPHHDVKLQKDRYGDYYLILVNETKSLSPSILHENVISCDPGVSCYLATYSPNGIGKMIASHYDRTLLQKLYKLDNLISNCKRAKKLSKLKLREKILCLRKKISNQKNELHDQTNNFLTKESSLIIYPKLPVVKMTLKAKRQLTTKTVRSMLGLGHGSALEKLKQKCLQRGVVMMMPDESYTTKTCSRCGKFNKCKNDRIYRCECGNNVNRDLHGAQNILLKCIE